jgi:hypothetical protein
MICIIVDDMVDTAKTLCNAAKALKVKEQQAYCVFLPRYGGSAYIKCEASQSFRYYFYRASEFVDNRF